MMTAQQSLKNSFTYYGILFSLEGLLFFLLPHVTVRLMHLSPIATGQAEQYVRIVGLLLSILGCHYVIAGVNMSIPLYRMSIMARPLILPMAAAFVYLGYLEWPFILVGIQDLISACWSYYCLKLYEAEENNKHKIG